MSHRNCRLYVGNLSSRTGESDLKYAFKKYGPIARCDLKNGFAFVEFEDYEDARDAVHSMNGRTLDGKRIIVENARSGRGGRDPPPRRASPYRVIVSNMSSRTSWQDLKDFARQCGSVSFTDVWIEHGEKFGIIEYNNRRDFEDALRELDDVKLDGKYVRVDKESHRHKSRSNSRSRSRSYSRSRSRRRSRSPRRRSRSTSRRRRSISSRRSKSPSGSPSASPKRRSNSRSASPKRRSNSRSVSPKRRNGSRSPRPASHSPIHSSETAPATLNAAQPQEEDSNDRNAEMVDQE